MARRGGSKIQRREAQGIAAKLEADMELGKGDHDTAYVRVDGRIVASFGIRRGRKSGHFHIPKQIRVSETQAMRLASCTMTYDDYVDLLRGKNLL